MLYWSAWAKKRQMCLEEEAHRGGIIKHVDFLCMPSATMDGLCHLQVTEVLLIRASHVTMLGGLGCAASMSTQKECLTRLMSNWPKWVMWPGHPSKSPGWMLVCISHREKIGVFLTTTLSRFFFLFYSFKKCIAWDIYIIRPEPSLLPPLQLPCIPQSGFLN